MLFVKGVESPPRIVIGTGLLWLAVVVIFFSDAGVPFPTFVAVLIGSIGIAFCWVFRFGMALSFGREKDNRVIRQHLGSWISVPMLLVFGIVLSNTSFLLLARLYLSANALLKSENVLSPIPAAELFTNPRRVGLFHVREFERFGTELRFMTNSCGLVDSCGLVFSPDGPPRQRGEDSFVHLYGPWWHLYQSF